MDNVELNKELYNECLKRKINKNKIRELLDKGGQPLGRISKHRKNEYLYNELLSDCSYDSKIKLFELTSLFISYDMTIRHSNYLNDGNDIDPLWELAFVTNNEGLKTLRLLLDVETDTESINELIDHIYTDHIFLELMGPRTEEHRAKELSKFTGWKNGILMLMLCLSYDYIYNDSEYLRSVVKPDNNNYDRHKFRYFENYDVEADNTMIFICEKESKTIVWNFPIE